MLPNTALKHARYAEEIDHYLFLLKDLVWKILQDAEEFSSLKKRFGELFKQGYPPGLQLPRAYLALIAHLLHLDPALIVPEQFPNGTALLDTQGLSQSRQIPEPMELAQLGILWMILGVRLNNEVLQRAGLKIAVWQAHLLDSQGRPHLSIWSRAQTFRPSHFYHWNYVLFSIAYRLTGEKGFLKIAELTQKEVWDPIAFPMSLLPLVPSKIPPPIPHFYHPFAEEITVGMMKFTTADMSLIAHLSGWNSGLFSCHKQEVALVNAGPQVGSFDDLTHFGITRTWGVKPRSFQEMNWEKTAYHCHLKGWTQLHALPFWLELDVQLQAGHANLKATLQDKEFPESLSMVLFLKCNKLILGGKHSLEMGTLERYEGKALPLELQGTKEKMALHPDPSLTMQVIPLSGGDHFWGAHFLVAFSFGPSFSLTIK